jgi:hypothetical protein
MLIHAWQRRQIAGQREGLLHAEALLQGLNLKFRIPKGISCEKCESSGGHPRDGLSIFRRYHGYDNSPREQQR